MVEINPSMHRGSLCFAIVGLVLTIVGTALDPWLDYKPEEAQSGKPALIGLWNYAGETKDGLTFAVNWRDEIDQQDPVYQAVEWWLEDSWVNASRGMVVAGIAIACIGIFIHIIFPLRKHSDLFSKVTFVYYFLSCIMILSGAAIWCSKIAQQAYTKNDNGQINEYLWTGSYGYAVWLVWIGGGFFLPAGGLAFEGRVLKIASGFINQRAMDYEKLMADSS